MFSTSFATFGPPMLSIVKKAFTPFDVFGTTVFGGSVGIWTLTLIVSSDGPPNTHVSWVMARTLIVFQPAPPSTTSGVNLAVIDVKGRRLGSRVITYGLALVPLPVTCALPARIVASCQSASSTTDASEPNGIARVSRGPFFWPSSKVNVKAPAPAVMAAAGALMVRLTPSTVPLVVWLVTVKRPLKFELLRCVVFVPTTSSTSPALNVSVLPDLSLVALALRVI